MVTAEEARRMRVNKGSVNHETYKDMHGKIQNRIKTAAARGATFVEYRIPPMVPGRPIYDVSHAVRYNQEKLRNAGFAVEVADGDVLRVDWKKPAAPRAQPKPQSQSPRPQPPPKPQPKKKTAELGPAFGTSESISQKLANLKEKLKW